MATYLNAHIYMDIGVYTHVCMMGDVKEQTEGPTIKWQALYN